MSTERNYQTREEVTSRIKVREFVLNPNGNIIDLEGLPLEEKNYVLQEHNLGFNSEAVSEKRDSTKLATKMVEMGWLGFEKASGKGHTKFYPKGAIVHKILETMINNFAQDELGANSVITPMVFNWNDAQIAGEAGTFYKNLYHVKPGTGQNSDQQVLRFGGDFGVFKLMQGVNLEEGHLPLRIYENGTMFRSNKPGEKSHIERADSFSLPCLYSFCKEDVEAGLEEFSFLHSKFSSLLQELGLSYSHSFEVNEIFFANYKDRIVDITKHDNQPALVRLASDKRHYFELKSDHTVENQFGSFNIQLDTENSKNYNIGYQASEGKVEKKPNIIVHSSLTSIEHWMLILLNNALNKKPQELPLWLAPTQIRMIPLGNDYNGSVMSFARDMRKAGIRVDVDDTEGKTNKKIKKAGMDLVPYTILWGREEVDSGNINLRRRDGELKSVNQNRLPDFVKDQFGAVNLDLKSILQPHISLSKIPPF